MFKTIDDFLGRLKNERNKTIRIFSAITNDSLAQSICDDHRTIARMAWHIITTYPEMMSQAGLNFSEVDKDDPVPDTIEDIIDAYNRITDELKSAVSSNWKDDDLTSEDNMYGEMWPRGLTLTILIHHEIHHRGQITVLLRQAGLKVPGIYGPAFEEWETYGQKPPVI